MHAFLITGGTATKRRDTINHRLDKTGVLPYDRLELAPHDKPSIGVSDVRIFIQRLQLSAHGAEGSAGIIPDAGLLSTEAQQALLKTIEEPPPHVKLYIGATSETQVLPTIASRCQVIPITSDNTIFTPEEISACTTLIQTIRSTASVGQRLTLIQSIGKTRDDAKRWIDCAIIASWQSTCSTSLIHALLEGKKLSQNNVNPFQILEHIFLTNTDLDKG